jgi:hypothetical protein
VFLAPRAQLEYVVHQRKSSLPRFFFPMHARSTRSTRQPIELEAMVENRLLTQVFGETSQLNSLSIPKLVFLNEAELEVLLILLLLMPWQILKDMLNVSPKQPPFTLSL